MNVPFNPPGAFAPPPPFNPPAPLHNLTPDLKEVLKTRVGRNLTDIILKLSGTVFYQESPVLQPLRQLAGDRGPGVQPPLVVSENDKLELLPKFYSAVPFTSYDDYFPFVSRIVDKSPCLDSEARDILSPGLPVYIAHSSGTSGAGSKYFPKYLNAGYVRNPWDGPNAPTQSICGVYSIRTTRVMEVVDASGNVIQHIPMSGISSLATRYHFGIGPKDDTEILSRKATYFSSPFAVWLISSRSAFIYMHAFFALMDPSILLMNVLFSTQLSDFIRVLQEHWDSMLDAIDKGYLPDILGIDQFRTHLEPFVKPSPSRAEELRAIKTGEIGWLNKIWPSLRIVRTILSGPYAAVLPKLRHHFGPAINFQNTLYASTECKVGTGYSANDHNLFRLNSRDHIELLDTETEHLPKNLSQQWEVETGKKYEIVVTSNDGLWRYTLNDIVEIAGFSPDDGQPLIKFVERKGVGFRIAGEFVPESLLQSAILGSLGLGIVQEFTTEMDERSFPRRYGFFVELQGESDPNLNAAEAITKLEDALFTNVGYKKYKGLGIIGNPTIRIVAPGSFKAYRDWKIQNTGFSSVQVKVPISTASIEVREWFTKRVILELGVSS